MDKRELQAILTLKDHLSPVLKGVRGRIKVFADDIKRLATHWVTTTLAAVSFGVALRNVIKASAEEEESIRKLQVSLTDAGISFKDNIEKIEQFAKSIQATTVYSDTQAYTLVQRLIPYTKDLDKAMEGARIATDLAASGLIEYDSAAKLVGNALAGNLEQLGRYIPELRASTNEQLKSMTQAEKSAYALQVLKRLYGGMAEGELNTFNGRLKQLSNYFNDLEEAIGDAITSSDAVQAVFKVLIDLIRDLTEKVKNNREEITSWIEKVIPALINAGGFIAKWILGIRLVYETALAIVTTVIAGLLNFFVLFKIRIEEIKIFFLAALELMLIGVRNFIASIQPFAKILKVEIVDNVVSKLNTAIEDFSNKIKDAQVNIQDANNDMRIHGQVVEESWRQLGRTAEEMQKVDQATTSFITKIKQETEEIKKNKQAFAERREEIARTTEKVKEQSEFMKEFNTRLSSWAHEATNLGKATADIVTKTLDGIADGTARAFRDSLEQGKSFSQSMKEMFRKLLFDIAEDIMRSQIKNALAQIFNIGGIQGGGGGFNFGNIFSSIGNFFGGFRLFGHEGGMVTPRGIQVLHGGGFAGLRSDEVPAILQTGERVLSRAETADYSRPRIINHNYTIYALDSQSFAEYVRRNREPILGIVNQDLEQDGRTRSSVRRFGR